jgi:hypothetical protein
MPSIGGSTGGPAGFCPAQLEASHTHTTANEAFLGKRIAPVYHGSSESSTSKEDSLVRSLKN